MYINVLTDPTFQSPPAGLCHHTKLQWRRGADAPGEFRGAQAVVMGESVYVVGGG